MSRTEWQNKVIYHIFVDRFAGYKHPEKSKTVNYIGGTIAGVTSKLPYIQSLGADAIWLSPFCTSSDYHGYSTTDFYGIDPHFGTVQDLQQLLDEAHRRSIRVILDFVPNHCSWEHPYFLDARQNPDSRYRDWFFFDKWPKKYRMFFDAPSLPKLNLDNPEVVAHLQGALRKWLQLGFDGARIDHIIGLSNQNIADLFGPLRREFPEAVFFGETWFQGVSWAFLRAVRVPKKYRIWLMWKFGLNPEKIFFGNYRGLIDGVLDFSTATDLLNYANSNSRWKQARLRRRVLKKSRMFGDDLLRFTFLDNHDVERFLFTCGNDPERLKAAAKLQFELKQPAIIYYGTEVGMTQRKSFAAAAKSSKYPDLLARQPMPWDAAHQNQDLLRFYQKIISERK